ncbi:GAF domain-containing hybrid sensor histidine kinase/response regulator [Paraglaciecola sp.]|uniref:GAF domain-containing hybrid sensor histidine kinase/response regulator n=1 Tax=Paraglaciecola sp. TaxID=1920173 RepID=UPI00273EF768|nr:GAF domain-containing hybrid sensor histidine kinase/response regulator [Paraglaciecola sp.]MDP5029970.1 ATP-binding protein [Paraglaciecola sp.]
MQSAPLTKNETARLQALYDYDILDTEAEKVFDDLTLLASEICNTPIALISLVDPNRQWFKSTIGIDATETPRDIAFCAHAIHQEQIFQVEDTLLDERFFDNPLVTEGPKIRFYAGTPLVTPQGHAVGTLCAIDSKPHRLNSTQINALEILGRNVISQMELRKKIRVLKEIDKNKTNFLSSMSHELRTPMNAIIGFSRLLLDDAANRGATDQSVEYLKHIDYSGKRLLGVINSILDINKIEAGMMTLSPTFIDVRQTIEQIAGMLSNSALEKGIHFQYQLADSLPTSLLLDEDKFSQVVINLVSNGIKFTPSNKQVTMRIHADNNRLIVEVEDEGEGISEADLSKLFTQFQQLGKSQGQQGSGLGLAISKGLVNLMGGSITVKSKPKLGSTFTVSLPLTLAKDEPVAGLVNKDQTHIFSANNIILVVEDNEINQVVIGAMLATFQLAPIFADSGEQALEKISQHDFNLVLMDIHLPGMNGIEASQCIRQQYPTLPIVALSADSFEYEKMKNNHSVFDDFLTKPVEKEALAKMLNVYLK